MANYVSTRDASQVVDSASAVLGLPTDGGLYVPAELPKLNYADLLELSYAARVDRVLRAFFDFDVGGIADKAFNGLDDPAPTVKIDDNAFFLELWHGRTCSSKDMALSVLPMLIERAKAAKGVDGDTLIIAPSGDVGVAAAKAFEYAQGNGVRLCVFYPHGETSDLVRRELNSLQSENAAIVGVSASADKVRAEVNACYQDSGLTAALGENNNTLVPTDGLNIGVIVSQIAYFFSAYCDLVNSDEIKPGAKIDFVLHMDDFGGVIAGYYAYRMGLPINKLVSVDTRPEFTDFIDSGVFDITAAPGTHLSDIERLIFDLSGNDAAITAFRMKSLGDGGRFSVTEGEVNVLHGIFAGDVAETEDAQNATDYMFEEYGYLVDAHTAYACASALDREFVRPTVMLSVADPYRTAEEVMTALGEKLPSDEDRFDNMEMLTACEPSEWLKSVLTKNPHDAPPITTSDIISYLLEQAKNKT